MGIAKLLVPALALASSAFAQGGGGGSGKKCSGTMTIQSSGDATALASCPTYSGSISFAPGAAGTIQLDGVRTITGDLEINGASNLTSLEADSLATIGGTFSLSKALQLSSLNMPYLSKVNTINWQYLPKIQGLQFSTGVSQVNSLSIQATALSSLDGFNITSAQMINLANNPNLALISIPATEITTALSIGGNGPMLNASFPYLASAGTISITNVSSLDFGGLKKSSGNIILGGNRFTNLTLPELTESDGLAILNNNDLKSISCPKYQSSTGPFRVENNTAFGGELSFPALTSVSSAVRFFGGFSSINLPDVNNVAGDMTVYITKTGSNLCNTFSHSYVKGLWSCNTATSSAGDSPSGTGSMSSATSKSAANAAQPAGSSAMGLFVALAGLIGMLL